MFSRETFQNLAKTSYFLFIISLFFPIRKVLLFNSAFQTGAYSDFTSFSLYLSDILLVTTCLLIFLPRGEKIKAFYHVVRRPAILFFWLILAYFWHFQETKSLNFYFSLKYAELVVAYGTSTLIFKEKGYFSYFSWLFITFCSFESLLALFQFISQKSLGLKLFGENLLTPAILGVAKIVSGGTQYIRGYGTFPHPNLLAAFLVLGVLFSFGLVCVSKKGTGQKLSAIALFINIFGLTVTFSRSGFLATGVALIFLGGYLAYTNASGFKRGLIITFVSMVLSFMLFFPFLNTRATLRDNAVLERIKYNQAGLEMIHDKPIFGVGIGESVLHMEQYMNRSLAPWEKQPVHNYFILAAAEVGLPGAIILLWLFWFHLQALLNKLFIKPENSIQALFASVLLAIFILMQFDHYFYTLQQTQMLLWVVLGISASLTLYSHADNLPKT